MESPGGIVHKNFIAVVDVMNEFVFGRVFLWHWWTLIIFIPHKLAWCIDKSIVKVALNTVTAPVARKLNIATLEVINPYKKLER